MLLFGFPQQIPALVAGHTAWRAGDGYDRGVPDLTYRQMRALEVGITQMMPAITRLQADGWVLLQDFVTIRGKQVRLVFGKDEASGRRP